MKDERQQSKGTKGDGAMEECVDLEVEGYTELHVVDDVDLGEFDGPVTALRDGNGKLYIVRRVLTASAVVSAAA